MDTKNEVFEYLINQLRQQVNSGPYKQQCEDLAHEVQSLKNQLRDASAQIKELQRGISVLANAFPREPEQSGCCKEDAHEWLPRKHKGCFVCSNCGARKS